MFIKSRYHIVIIDNGEFGYTGKREIYLPLPYSEINMMKCLKKAWNHFNKVCPPDWSVFAYYESEEGEWHDMAQWWIYEELEYREELDLPFN